MIRRLLSLCLLLLAAAAPAAAQQDAIPRLTGRVVDLADLLTPETEKLLSAMMAAHEDSTTNQIAVLTIPVLGASTIEEYALQVARAWELGQAGRDNGVLLLVSRDDRELRIEVGYGLEGALPDALAARIIRSEMVPRFRDGDFDAGVRDGVTAIIGALEGTYAPAEETTSGDDIDDMPLFARLFMGFMFVVMPGFFAFAGLMQAGCMRWVLFFFLMPFFFAGGTILFGSVTGGIVLLVLYAIAFQVLARHPKFVEIQEKAAEAAKTGKKVPVTIGGMTFHVGGSSSSGGSSFSSGSSFSGGGGSFGGGGASGSW